jgi:hypothetical protein
VGDSFLWAVFLITEVAQNLGLLTSTEKRSVLILTKMGWATFWAKFSQTHLVTLSAANPPNCESKQRIINVCLIEP